MEPADFGYDQRHVRLRGPAKGGGTRFFFVSPAEAGSEFYNRPTQDSAFGFVLG